MEWTCHAEGSIQHTWQRITSAWGADMLTLAYGSLFFPCSMAHLCISFHSTPSEAAIIWSAALAKRQCLGQKVSSRAVKLVYSHSDQVRNCLGGSLRLAGPTFMHGDDSSFSIMMHHPAWPQP